MERKNGRTCRDCGELIGERRTARGYADQCDPCAQETDEPQRYLGFNDGSLNKSTSIAVYRGDDPEVRKKISTQKNRVG